MKIKYLYIVSIFFFNSVFSYGQECIQVNEIGKLIKLNMEKKFVDFDSLNLTLFLKFKIRKNGTLDSIWINGPEVINIDYDRYIKETKAESLKLLYSLSKNEYLLKKAIFEYLRSDKFSVCEDNFYDGFYLLPLVADFRKNKLHFNLENQIEALKYFIKPGIQQYYFLEPIRFGKPCKDCL